jgi:opine dehydrogenase
MANFLCNFTRAERGEAWANYGGITPSVARLIEALDIERLALAAAFGLKVRTIHDHFHLSFGVPRGPLAEMAAAVFAKRPQLMGPATTDTRFVTEDVPFGLMPLVVLAAATDVKMPLHEAGIALFSALYGRNFRAENDLLADLELNGVHPNAFHARLRNGW